MEPFQLSREEVRELDRRAIEDYGVPGIVLMENAGRGSAELLRQLNPKKQPVMILCGPGNNGGDGFVIARHLDNLGWPITVYAVPRPARDLHRHTVTRDGWYDGLPPDALANFRILAASGVEVAPLHDANHFESGPFFEAARRSAWIVDALFGTGLSRPLTAFNELISCVAAARTPVLAVDIPSGLDCDSGEPLGPTIRAAHTATFVAQKKGFLNPASRAWTGEIHVIDIGAPRVLIDEYRNRER